MRKNIAIIGGGASGLIASIIAARAGHKVIIFEKSSKLGRKILATGNGRCNITNEEIKVENYHGLQLSFVKDILNIFGFYEAKKFFSELGLEMIVGDKGRLYPMSLQSSTVVDFLSYEAKKLGVKIMLNCEVETLKKVGVEFKVLDSSFDSVLISSGTLAMPTLGSSDSGYRFAREFGHQIIKPFPSLVQLVCENSMIKEASGVKIDAVVELFIDSTPVTSARGDLLFTNYGLSGSVSLDISRFAALAFTKKQDAHVVIDLLPDMSLETLKSLLKKLIQLKKPSDFWLNGIIHKKLINLIFSEAKLSLTNELNTKSVNKLAYAIKNLKIIINGTKGAKSCEVMAGGVKTSDVNSKTMESKLVKGLFFSGEVLDVDGDCGGFNLHFAWASGYIAGSNF